MIENEKELLRKIARLECELDEQKMISQAAHHRIAEKIVDEAWFKSKIESLLSELSGRADQWAAHSALAARADPKSKRFKVKRRDEMKDRFMDTLNKIKGEAE